MEKLNLVEIKGLYKEVASSTDSGSAAGGRLTILHDISLDVRRGESLAIVGASGSGKTTLLGLMAGLDLALPCAVGCSGLSSSPFSCCRP